MRTLRFTVTALLAGPLFCATAHAGVYLESVDKELDSSKAPAAAKMWFDGGRMRTERTGRDGDLEVVIFRNQAMYTIDSKSKSYRVIDKAAADRMGAQVANAKKQMEARMASMPPEQRKQVEEMMAKMGKGGAGGLMPGAPKPPQRTLQNSGRTETVAGIKCTIWEAFEDGKKAEELCAAPGGSVPGGDEVIKTFRDMSAMLSSFTESLGNRSANQPWNDMDKINGVPILTRDFEDGKASSEMRLTVARKESVPGASFEVPAGYKEKKLDLAHPGGSDED
jgi:hypothetical protein